MYGGRTRTHMVIALAAATMSDSFSALSIARNRDGEPRPFRSGGKASAKFYGRNGSGRINMPGEMMTKAGKRAQMQKDANRASPRRGRRR